MNLGILLTVGLVLLGGAMSMSYVERPDMSETKTCTACKAGLKELHESVTANLLTKAGDKIVKMACGKLWVIPKSLCKKYGNKIMKPIIDVVEDYMKGAKLCKLMKVCEEGTAISFTVDDFDLTDEKTACVKCQLLVSKGKSVVMYKKEMLKHVVLEMMHKCSDEELGIPEELCTDMVNEFGVEIIDSLIAAIPEFETCSALGKCE